MLFWWLGVCGSLVGFVWIVFNTCCWVLITYVGLSFAVVWFCMVFACCFRLGCVLVNSVACILFYNLWFCLLYFVMFCLLIAGWDGLWLVTGLFVACFLVLVDLLIVCCWCCGIVVVLKGSFLLLFVLLCFDLVLCCFVCLFVCRRLCCFTECHLVVWCGLMLCCACLFECVVIVLVICLLVVLDWCWF